MRAGKLFVFLLLTGIVSLSSCGDEPTCLDQYTNLVKIHFVDSAGVSKEIIINAVWTTEDSTALPEYENDTLSSISLPLNPVWETTTYVFQQADRQDTLGLSYSVVAKLISPACGLDAAYDDLDTTKVTFDNFTIIDWTIHQDITVNFEVTY